MEYLGFDVGYGWKPAALKMQPLRDMKICDDPKKGACNFCRRHIHNVTYSSACPTDLKKSHPWPRISKEEEWFLLCIHGIPTVFTRKRKNARRMQRSKNAGNTPLCVTSNGRIRQPHEGSMPFSKPLKSKKTVLQLWHAMPAPQKDMDGPHSHVFLRPRSFGSKPSKMTPESPPP